jgi:hypothetical protein
MGKDAHSPRNSGPKPVAVEDVAESITLLRGRRVILDRELAAIYGVETRALNQSVKRNIERFPEDFMFQITAKEAESSRSQIVILNAGRGRNIKYLPYAFTEHGAIQAANVLNSPRAVQMGIYVVRAGGVRDPSPAGRVAHTTRGIARKGCSVGLRAQPLSGQRIDAAAPLKSTRVLTLAERAQPTLHPFLARTCPKRATVRFRTPGARP